MAVSGTCSLDPEGGRRIRRGIKRRRSRVGVREKHGGLKSKSERKWRKDLWTANLLSKHCQMVRSIGQKMSARTVDVKWVVESHTSFASQTHGRCREPPPPLPKADITMFWSHLGWGDIFLGFHFPAWFEVMNKHFHKASIFARSYVVKSIKNMTKIH